MPKPKASSSKARGQLPLTTYFTPSSPAKQRVNRKRKQPPTASLQDDTASNDHPLTKGKVKENVSPVVSPHSTPTRKRLKLHALGSETNVLSGASAHGESSKPHANADKECEIIEIPDSPAPSPTTLYVGLPTPITALKRRTGPVQQSTPTPAPRPIEQPVASTSTPQMPSTRHTKPIQQQPTPSTLVRPRRHPIQGSPAASSDSPPRASWVRQQRRAPSPFTIVPSSQGSQELELNPFIEDTSSKDETGLFKLPCLPSRLQSLDLPGPSTTFVPQPASPRGLTLNTTRTPSKRRDVIIASSQGDEEELAFWSPSRANRQNEDFYDVVPSSVPGEEELLLSGTSNLPEKDSISPLRSPLNGSIGRSLAPRQPGSAQESLPMLPLAGLSELSVPRSPHTPRRSAKSKGAFVGVTPIFRTPGRTPGADSGHGASVSPEKGNKAQVAAQVPPDESQTQPESPIEKRVVPSSPASSVTVPESPRSPFKTPRKSQKTPGKSCSAVIDESQTQPESPYFTTPNKPLHDEQVVEEDAPSSQTVPESPRWLIQDGGNEAAEIDDSSQTVPESPRWRVPTPITTPSQKVRGRLPDDDDPFAPAPASLPLADYDENQPRADASAPPAEASYDPYDDGSQTQPDAWPLTPRNKRMMRRLQFIRRKQRVAAAEQDHDMLSDTPLSIPSDFDEDVALSEIGSDLPSPVREFLAMDI